MEGICKVLEDNPAGLCFFCDELIGWLGSMDKYRRNGNDVNKWLSIFNCSPIFVDRRSVDDKITIAEPFVSVIGSGFGADFLVFSHVGSHHSRKVAFDAWNIRLPGRVGLTLVLRGGPHLLCGRRRRSA